MITIHTLRVVAIQSEGRIINDTRCVLKVSNVIMRDAFECVMARMSVQLTGSFSQLVNFFYLPCFIIFPKQFNSYHIIAMYLLFALEIRRIDRLALNFEFVNMYSTLHASYIQLNKCVFTLCSRIVTK